MKSGKVSGLACAATAIAASWFTAPAFAEVRQFNVPSADAGKSIPEFARQAHIDIIAPGDQLHGVITPPVKGAYDVFVALNLMLKGTDLKVRRLAEGIVTLSRLDVKKTEEREEDMMLKNSVSVLAMLLGTTSLFGVSQVHAQPADAPQGVETVTVTGSRVISDIANSPTPITAVSTEQLLTTTPTNHRGRLEQAADFPEQRVEPQPHQRRQQRRRRLPQPAQFRASSAPWCCWMACAFRPRTRTAASISAPCRRR